MCFYKIVMIIIHQVADIIFAYRIGGLDGVRRDVAVVLKAIVHDTFGAVVTIALIVTVFTKIMVETDAVGQSVLVNEIHKLIHGLCPNDFYVSANRREYQPIRPGVERIAAVIQP